jgi:hypothetical protein
VDTPGDILANSPPNVRTAEEDAAIADVVVAILADPSFRASGPT